MKRKHTLLIVIVLAVLASCTTKPAIPPEESGPLARMDAGEDFYLLARPAEHPDLAASVLGNMMETDPEEMAAALERTSLTLIAGRFGTSEEGLEFSGILEGDYPAFFVRRALRKSKDWERQEEKVWKGPDEILADTIFRDTLIAASRDERLEGLQDAMTGIAGSEDVLSRSDREWWEGGRPAMMLYLPSLGVLPMPDGLPAVPDNSSLTAVMTDASIAGDRGEAYTLSVDLRFGDDRSARLWALGLRIYLAARLGRSPYEEERAAMSTVAVKVEGSSIALDGWSMSPFAWARFLSEFRENGGL